MMAGRECIPGCASNCAAGCLMCRAHWKTVSAEKRKALFAAWLRWQRGEISDAKYQRLAVHSLNTADVLEAVAL